MGEEEWGKGGGERRLGYRGDLLSVLPKGASGYIVDGERAGADLGV